MGSIEQASEPLPRLECTLLTSDQPTGLQQLERLSLGDDLQDLPPDIQNKYFALTALAALLSYVSASQGVSFSDCSLHFQWAAAEGTMLIDQVTARSLELVSNLSTGKGASLLATLDRTRTPMGRRLLRIAILQPCTDEATIKTRLDAVDELLSDEQSFFDVQAGGF